MEVKKKKLFLDKVQLQSLILAVYHIVTCLLGSLFKNLSIKI